MQKNYYKVYPSNPIANTYARNRQLIEQIRLEASQLKQPLVQDPTIVKQETTTPKTPPVNCNFFQSTRPKEQTAANSAPIPNQATTEIIVENKTPNTIFEQNSFPATSIISEEHAIPPQFNK